jgi:hypothetical protein
MLMQNGNVIAYASR